MSFQFPEHRIPPSFNPAPDSYPAMLVMRETADIPTGLTADERERKARRVTRRVLDTFWLDMGAAHFSAAMQINRAHPLHEWYMTNARQNRERIARDREAERAARMAAVAA